MLGPMGRWVDRDAVPRPRIAIFSSDAGLCRRIESIIDCQPDLEWICAVRTVERAISLGRSRVVDVLLVDSASDPQWKLCLMSNRLFPETALVALFAVSPRSSVASAWAVLHGVRSIVQLDMEPADLTNIIRRTAAGDPDFTLWDRRSSDPVPTRSRSGKEVPPRRTDDPRQPMSIRVRNFRQRP